MKTNKVSSDCLTEEENALATNKIIVLISIHNHGSVKFGPYNTEHGHMQKEFPKGKNITLIATPEKDYKFSFWQQKIKKEGGYSFLSSKLKTTLIGPDKNREIRAHFVKSTRNNLLINTNQMQNLKKRVTLKGVQMVSNSAAKERPEIIDIGDNKIAMYAQYTHVKSVDRRYRAIVTEIACSGKDSCVRVNYKPDGIKGREFNSTYELRIFYTVKDIFEN